MGDVKTTVTLELEGKLVHATSDKSIEELEGLIQAERLISVFIGDEEIIVQSGSIEFLRKGDQRHKTLPID